MKKIKIKIKNDRLKVSIPADYLENAFEAGITTNVTGTVNNRKEMLEYFASAFNADEDDSHFGRFVDAVCENAFHSGETFVDDEEE